LAFFAASSILSPAFSICCPGFFLLPYRFPFRRVPPGIPVSVSRIAPQPRCPSQTLQHTDQISSFVSPESGCFMPKGHKDLFEVNSRDDRAGFCELGDKAAHACKPHLTDRAVLRRSGVVIASAKLFQGLKNDKIVTVSNVIG